MYGNTELDSQTIYAFARCEQFIRDFAEAHHISFNELGIRVAELLHTQTSGEVRGVDDRMPPLRTEATEGDQTTREVEVDERPHRKTQMIPCKHCGKKFSTTQMGNHVRYSHMTGKKARVRGMTLPKIMAMRKQGMSWDAISKHFNVSANSVWRIGREASAKMNITKIKPKKRHLSPKNLETLRAQAAHARAVRAANRAALEMPKVAEDALSQYHDAISSEPEPAAVGANGSTY